MKDQIFANKKTINNFSFNEEVALVFNDMINRSIPGYQTILQNIPIIANHFLENDSLIYDLGTSLGSVIFHLREKINPTCRIIGIDNSKFMVQKCNDNLLLQTHLNPNLAKYRIKQEDLLTCYFEKSQLIIMNFTLQFIEPSKKLNILKKIRNSLNNSGVFILSEKIESDNLLNNLHIKFKKSKGYSDLEIGQKRQALENVMILDTIETQKERLLNAGFSKIIPWFTCFNFTSIIALP